jgi:hypothetical protein
MKITVNCNQFRQAFADVGGHNFSWLGLAALFDYFERLEEDLGEQIELDPIAIRCEYYEATPYEIAEFYNIDINDLDADETLETVLEFLKDATTVVDVIKDGTITIVYLQC